MTTTADRNTYRAHLERRLIESHVPPGLHEGLIEYIADRRPTGGFLLAVLSNDLREACRRADLVNRASLFELVSFLYNYAPMACWGSPAAVEQWLAEPSAPPCVFE